MANITIGGKLYTTTELPFSALKKSWPHIKSMQAAFKNATERGEQEDPIESMSRAIGVISAVLGKNFPELDTSEKVEDLITARECQNLDAFIVEMMSESGFMQAPNSGEPAPAEDSSAVSPSTETSTESSPSSSLEDAEAGTR